MKQLKLMILVLVGVLTAVASAAPIDWAPVEDTAGIDDLIEGTVVAALNGSASDVTVNGILFENFGLGIGFVENSYDSPLISTGDANFDTLISSFTYGGGTSPTLTLDGLTIGATYQVQVFFNDQRAAFAGRVMTIGDGLGNSVDLAASNTGGAVDDYGHFAVGTVVADAVTQDIVLTTNGFGNAHLTALLVTEVSPGATNPSPAQNDDNVALDVTLGWDAMKIPDPADPNIQIVNPDLIRHEVYLSNGNAADPNVTFLGQVAAGSPVNPTATYGPLSLNRDSTYYWRVDEIVPDPNGGEIAVSGPLWMFMTVPSDPIINTDPADQFVDADNTVSVDFVVDASNPFYPGGTLTGPTDGLAYQWQFDDGSGSSDLTGETSATLTVTTDTGDGHEGSYQCIVTIVDNGAGGTGGTASSGTAKLIYKKLLGHWPFDGDANDAVGTNHGTTSVSEYVTGRLGQGIRFRGGGGNPDETEGTAVKVSALPYALSGQFTISWWELTEPNALIDDWDTMVTLGDGNLQQVLLSGDQTEFCYFNYYGSGAYSDGPGEWIDRDPDWQRFDVWQQHVMTFDGERFRKYYNGIEIPSQNTEEDGVTDIDGALFNAAMTALPDPIWVGNQDDAYGTFNNGADVAIDELMLYNYAMTADEAAQAYVSIAGGTVCQLSPGHVKAHDIMLDKPVMDLNGDCDIDINDLQMLVSTWLDDGFFDPQP